MRQTYVTICYLSVSGQRETVCFSLNWVIVTCHSRDVWTKFSLLGNQEKTMGLYSLDTNVSPRFLGCCLYVVSLRTLNIFTVTCRSQTLWAVWHQGLLWSVCQHRHFLLECCCHQPPWRHGCPVHLLCSWRTYRPLQADPGAVDADWVYLAL